MWGADTRARTLGHPRRGSNVVPIGLVVAIAFACVIIAVLTSARRADEVILEHERRIFVNEISERREQVVREAENTVAYAGAVRRIWVDFDHKWVHARVGLRSKSYYGHDAVFVLDGADRVVYSLGGDETSAPSNTELGEIGPIVDAIRGRPTAARIDVTAATVDAETGMKRPAHASRMQKFRGQPAILAAVGLVRYEEDVAVPDGPSPLLIAVELIDARFLAGVGERLKLANLREAGTGPVSFADQTASLLDDDGSTVSRFAWTPKRPGAEIVEKTLPFIALAVIGLGLLAAFAVRYMRTTAATITAGEDQLRHLAMHDALSGLPNRTYFGERLAQVIGDVKNGGAPAAVMCIDLDHFKEVNDTLGHHVGDELIGAVTRRLRGIIRDDELVARLGGDEFAIITPGASDTWTLNAIADRILQRLCAPYAIMGHTIVIGASIGIAVIDHPSLHAADVMRYADIALYRAKNEGRRRACIYDEEMNADLLQRKDLENDLREALANNALELAYQPVFSVDGEQVVGVEALARWNHPKRGAIPPSIFIPVAEHSGLIIALGDWALKRACLDSAAWPISVAVNVSPLQFRRPDFADGVEKILNETGFDAKRLELEITEFDVARQSRCGERRDDAAQGTGRRACARRLRHRLFELALFAPPPLRQAQDRLELRALDRQRDRCSADRSRGHQPRSRPRHEGDGGRRRDRRPASVPARCRRALPARLPLRPARAERGDRAPPRKAGRARRHGARPRRLTANVRRAS